MNGTGAHMAGPLQEVMDRLLDVDPASAPHSNVPTGFTPLDPVLGGGLRTGDLIVIGGRPASGKTALCMQWARHGADAGFPVVIASLEHSPSDLLERFLLIECGSMPPGERPDPTKVRATLSALFAGRVSWEQACQQIPQLETARARVNERAQRLHVLSGSDIGMEEIVAHTAAIDGPKMVLIDYLQKVADHSEDHDPERITRDAKSLALAENAAVLAIASTDHDGLRAQRVRLSHLRAAEAIAFEADLALVIEEKVNAVSRVHTAFDDVRRREHAAWSVLTVEKHRRGAAGVALEFRRDLAASRFEPEGGVTSERLEEDIDAVI